MTDALPGADDYWSQLITDRGVGRGGYSIFGDILGRPIVRRFETIHSTGDSNP
ncbi:hypothetical protein [Corynebacterium halotolerans]|uniref:hypothetical protein n=1 Tax=Corynebacterium halotolerans TaxID=225326 RepID=UPI0012B56EDB|nr:hypothetical protein [Corynebacterium halotolerans]